MKANRWAIINAGGIREPGADELQTDVMSFMAILGFCLMAIFAIVQSLPLAPTDSRPELETHNRLRSDIRSLQQQLQQLTTEAERLQARVVALRAQEQQLNLRLQQNHRELQERTDDLESRSRQLITRSSDLVIRSQQLAEANRQLQALKQQLEGQQQRLERLNADLWEGQQSLSSLRKRLQMETVIFQQQRQQLTQLHNLRQLQRSPQDRLQGAESDRSLPPVPAAVEERPVANAASSPAPVSRDPAAISEPSISAPQASPQPEVEAPPSQPHAAPAPPVEPTEAGFNLRFESDSALLQLLDRDKLQLYAMIHKRAWQFSGPSQDYRMTETRPPGLFHEMTTHTVPKVLVRQVLHSRSVFALDKVTWAVVLPGHIRQRINTLMDQFPDGTLVIGADGDVRREKARPETSPREHVRHQSLGQQNGSRSSVWQVRS